MTTTRRFTLFLANRQAIRGWEGKELFFYQSENSRRNVFFSRLTTYMPTKIQQDNKTNPSIVELGLYPKKKKFGISLFCQEYCFSHVSETRCIGISWFFKCPVSLYNQSYLDWSFETMWHRSLLTFTMLPKLKSFKKLLRINPLHKWWNHNFYPVGSNFIAP